MADKVVVVRLRAAVGEYTSGMARAGGTAVAFGNQVGGAAKKHTKAMGEAKQTMGRLATGAAIAGKLILAGIGGAMVVSAKAAIDFESSLAGVAKTVEGTDTQIRAIGESMRRLSLDIPVNVNELNRIAELGGQLGVQIPNLVEFTEVIAALGVTTNLSTEEAATGLARLANVTGLSQDDFGRLGSAIVDLGNNFATTESEILTFALRIAPAAQTVGATADEVLGLAAALSSMGIPAERGGTAVQQMMTIIGSAARSGGDELQAMADIAGVTAEEFQNLALTSPTDALVLLATALGEANESGENVFLMMKALGINGKRAQAVLLAMANNTDLLVDSLDKSEVAMDENTALFEEAAKRYGTTESEIRLMANAFTDLRIEIGQNLVPWIKDTISTIGSLFRIMKENSGVLKTVGVLLGFIALGLLSIGITKAIGAMIAFGTSVRAAIVTLGGLRASMALTVGTATALTTVLTLGLSLVIAGLAKLAWDAARNLALLRENAKEFETAVRDGADPLEAFMDVLDPDRIEGAAAGMEDIGASIQDIAEAGSNLDIAELERLLALLEERERVAKGEQAAAITFGVGLEDVDEIVARANANADAIAILKEAIGTDEQFISERAQKMGLAFLAAETDTALAFDGMLVAAQNFLKNNQFATDQDFIRFMTGEMRFDGFQGAADGIIATSDAAILAEQSWDAWLRTVDRADDVGDFREDAGELATEWAEEVTEAFDEVTEALLENFPAWDEYGETVVLNLDKILAAQDKFLEDMRQWGPAYESLIGNVSAATLQWFEDLDPLQQGAFGRLFASDPLALEQFADDLDENLGEAARLADEHLVTRLPEILGSAALTINQKINALVTDLGLLPSAAEQMVGAYEDGLAVFFAELPNHLSQNVIDMLRRLLDPNNQNAAETIRQQGVAAGALFIDGINLSLENANLSDVVIKTVTDPVVKTIEEEWSQSSPSRVAIGLGEGFVEGLGIGMTGSLDRDIFKQVVPSFQASLNAVVPSSSTTEHNTREGDTFNIHGNELSEAIRLAGSLAGITRRMETKVGR